ncbi:MAG TPA: phospho-sugar mutase, partial [Symbiobacteriaceae bacterium]|nr:phospho-sugar mutase [Symbiobacteriaceae bacterium]
MASTWERYRLWLEHPCFDAATQAELAGLKDQPGEIEDRFYRDLDFGTGGLRGVIGAGTNRMNRYVIRQAARGLAVYVSAFGLEAKRKGVVIAHDSRRFSPQFAREAALTLAAAGV